MFKLLRKIKTVANEFEGVVKKVKWLEREFEEMKGDMVQILTNLERLKAYEERVEDEVVNKAHALAVAEFDAVLNRFRKEVKEARQVLEEVKRARVELEPVFDTLKDYQEFSTEVKGELVRLNAVLKGLEERVSALETKESSRRGRSE